jgi:hypothetical protein
MGYVFIFLSSIFLSAFPVRLRYYRAALTCGHLWSSSAQAQPSGKFQHGNFRRQIGA